ncbi:glycosyltransferase family 2 protein [Pelolinea submarina]|uniref:Undecaprenyl-phosphate 4-deoxy-4-formamido-L-arabinose transferase n=1 Tax=Pelolinea submarina TaxID=913107 RepID=A0A347ZSI8_9CHLR|nr:glycosyltransferase family 2 protein [Pelolinea submarina]REG11164.1 undecaprenyl-phosphate 4-deoxy-4-formamido-L-arabinose transferase [Pelolinea submarina]BBB48269.1 undecaprenyl-phosphate 4-deoxy-4-formamido-L-arabinose transferase [Pelolinea submarina]
MKENLSVVIPVYNSEKTLTELTQRIDAALKERCDRYEIILVNDGSRDASWSTVKQLMQANPAIRGINLMRNYGQHNALLCGIRAARYEITVTMDDDLQHLPEEIGKLLDKLAEGYDVVYGIPEKLVHSLWRNLSSKLSKRFLARILGLKRLKYISAFRAFKTDLRRSFASFNGPNVIMDALLTWGTDNFGTVEVVEQQRSVGRSNYTLGKLINLGMTVLTGFSTIPLKFASFTGFFLTLFGVGILIYAVIRSLQEGSVPGFPFLASIISIFSGAQLFALGIFGEYLGSIFHRSMNQPAYTLAEDNEDITSKG